MSTVDSVKSDINDAMRMTSEVSILVQSDTHRFQSSVCDQSWPDIPASNSELMIKKYRNKIRLQSGFGSVHVCLSFPKMHVLNRVVTKGLGSEITQVNITCNELLCSKEFYRKVSHKWFPLYSIAEWCAWWFVYYLRRAWCAYIWDQGDGRRFRLLCSWTSL